MRCKCRRKLVKNGKTRSGTQRWKCSTCGKTGIRQRKVRFNCRLLFQYLVEGQTISWLAYHYGLHPNTIRNRLSLLLGKSPPLNFPHVTNQAIWLATDATHFKQWGCLYITKAVGVSQPLAVSFCHRESFETAVEHLNSLRKLSVLGYTTDGRKGLVMAYHQLFPHAVHQRCLVHIQMRVRTLLTSQPKLPAGQDLLYLSCQLTKVNNTAQANCLWELFKDWYVQYKTILKERTHLGKSWWYTHRNLRSAWKHVLNAADNLFVFLDYPTSINNNNHLEGTFGQRKPALYRHRGLSRSKIASALLWTFYLRNKH
jgi:hypothetical protein